jgi:hypothetical protein
MAIHLQAYLEPLYQVMAFGPFKKKYIITSRYARTLDYGHNPWKKKIALFYTKTIQRAAYIPLHPNGSR